MTAIFNFFHVKTIRSTQCVLLIVWFVYFSLFHFHKWNNKLYNVYVYILYIPMWSIIIVRYVKMFIYFGFGMCFKYVCVLVIYIYVQNDQQPDFIIAYAKGRSNLKYATMIKWSAFCAFCFLVVEVWAILMGHNQMRAACIIWN